MTLFLVRWLLLLHAVALELWVLGRAGGLTPDVSAVLVAFCVLDVVPARVPYVLLPLAVCRSLLHPGGFAFHLWLLLAGYSVLLPMRRVLFPERWQFRMVVGLAAAVLLSVGQGLALTAHGIDPLGRHLVGFVLTGLVTPGATLLLGIAYRGIVTPLPRVESDSPAGAA